MDLKFRQAQPTDAASCIEVRGLTRQNPASVQVLREQFGVTETSLNSALSQNQVTGVVCLDQEQVIGFCLGDTSSGEVQVLAVLPEYEGVGVGKTLLMFLVEQLFELGFERLFLMASPDPEIRAHGFYRHLGWVPTEETDAIGDQRLELAKLE